MVDLIVTLILVVILALAGWYVYKARKSGKKCIGCPDGCCSKKNDGSSCCCGCGGTQE